MNSQIVIYLIKRNVLKAFKRENHKKNTKLPKTFVESYNAESMIVDIENFRDFVVIK